MLVESLLLEQSLKAQIYGYLGRHYDLRDKLDEAEAAFRESIRIHRAALSDRPNYARGRECAVRDLVEFGKLLAKHGQLAEAEEVLREATQVPRQLRDDFPATKAYQSLVHSAMSPLFDVLQRQGRDEEVMRVLTNMPMTCARDFSFRGAQFDKLQQKDRAKDDFQHAEQLSTQEIAVDPADFDAWRARGSARVYLQQFHSAFVDFRQAHELEPEVLDVLYESIDACLASGKFDEATNYCRAAIDTDSLTLDQIHDHAVKEWRGKGRHQEAICLYSFVLERKPDHIESLRYRGLSFGELRQFDKALADFTNAIRLAPYNADLRRGQGIVYGRMKQHAKELEAYNEAIRLAPDNADNWAARGGANFALRHYDKSLDDANECLRLNPKHAGGWNNRGITYFKLERFDDAISDLSEAIRLAPKKTDHFSNRGSAYFSSKKYQQAIDDFTEAIRLDLRSARNHHLRGLARGAISQFEDAAIDFSEAIRLDPNDLPSWQNRAICYRELKQPLKAIEDYSEAIRLSPEDAGYFRGRASAYFEIKNFDKALADYNEAIRLTAEKSPQWTFYFSRAECFIGLGRFAEAAVDYQTSIKLEASNPELLNNFATLLATAPLDALRNGNQALEMAKKACELTEYKHPAPLSTMAEAYAETGDFSAAIEWMEKALKLVTEEEYRKQLSVELDSFRNSKPWRSQPAASGN
jgi:tetratricopeptide (TPR) repeat protein